MGNIFMGNERHPCYCK